MSPPLPKREDIKLIASDVDGTLLDHHHKFHEKNFEVLRRIRDTYPELPICFATGKQRCATEEIRRRLDLDVFPAAHLNGCIVYRGSGIVEYEVSLSWEMLSEIIDLCKKEDFSLMIYDYDYVHCVHYAKHDPEASYARQLAEYGEWVKNYTAEEIPAVIEQFKSGKNKAIKLGVCGALDNQDYIKNSVQHCKSFSEFAITQAIPFCVELIPFTHNKGTAVRDMCRMMNVDLKNCVTFGDGDNDVPMFKVSGYSVHMGNAMPSPRETAQYGTVGNDEGGVGVWLENVFFPEDAQ